MLIRPLFVVNLRYLIKYYMYSEVHTVCTCTAAARSADDYRLEVRF